MHLIFSLRKSWRVAHRTPMVRGLSPGATMAGSNVCETLKLTPAEYQRVLEVLGTDTKPASGIWRQWQRFTVPPNIELFFQFIQTEGPDFYFRIYARNISAGGLGFLHGAFPRSARRPRPC